MSSRVATVDERSKTLAWLISQARDHQGDGVDALHTPESTRARADEALENGEIALSEDLAWELVASVSRRWEELVIQELRSLDNLEVVNLLSLAVELGTDANLRSSIWLTLRAHVFKANVDTGMAARDVTDLIEQLSAYGKSHDTYPEEHNTLAVDTSVDEPDLAGLTMESGSCGASVNTRMGEHDVQGHTEQSTIVPGMPLRSIDDTLAFLDDMLESVKEDRRDPATAVATSTVSGWAYYPGASPALLQLDGDAVATSETMSDWVITRANELIRPQTAPYRLRLEAYRSCCRAVCIEARLRLVNGRLDVSHIHEWYENRVSELTVPRVTDSQTAITAQDIAQETDSYLALLCAEWLVDNGSPSHALRNMSLAGNLRDSNLAASVRASAYSSLGLTTKTRRAIEGLQSTEDPSLMWTLGRVLCELGDEQGLDHLRSAVHLPEQLYFWEARARMRLLLAEKEVEEGDPARAVRLVGDLVAMKDSWIRVHAKVILSEALVTLARDDPSHEAEQLARANGILRPLLSDGIVDTPDRVLPRTLAALGEIELLNGDCVSGLDYFRNATVELRRKPPTTWDMSDYGPVTKFSPDPVTSQNYWRRPWRRNWTRVAELCLIAELANNADAESAFMQLQRYRVITHAGTVAELGGFTPEASLSNSQRERLEGLRGRARQLETEISRSRNEAGQLAAYINRQQPNVRPPPDLNVLLQETLGKLDEEKAKHSEVEADIELLESTAHQTRGYLAAVDEIQLPTVCEITSLLSQFDAAIIELLRLDGTRWGLPTRWYAFIVTSKGVERIQLQEDGEDGFDRELRLLRGNRERLDNATLHILSDRIVRRLPRHVFRRRHLFIAADGDAWAVPFRSLTRPRWWFVPQKLTDSELYANWPVPEAVKRWVDSLTTRMDSGVVCNVISTTHLIRLVRRSWEERERLGVVIGSSGASGDRILCQGLARSLEVRPPRGRVGGIPWRRYPGSLEEHSPQYRDRPEWMDGTSEVFLVSCHTTFTDNPSTVAQFHFDDGVMTLAEFLSQSRHRANLAIILSCNISHPARGDDRAFHRIGSAGFGMMEALQADSIVATTNEVTADVAFVLGRFLISELARGDDLHTALANSQQRLRECKVADVISMLKRFEREVPETAQWLSRLGSFEPTSPAFPRACDTEPFYILGLPDVVLSSNE